VRGVRGLTRGTRVVAVGAVMLGLGMSGCGSDEDSPATSADAGSPPREVTAPNDDSAERSGTGKGGNASEEQVVAKVVAGMYADFVASDSAGVCAAMSDDVQEQIAQQVPGGSTVAPANRTCESSLSQFFDVAAKTGLLDRSRKAQVRRVSVRGRSATAAVTFGGRSGKVKLVKEGGQWRFGSVPAAAGKQS
jgi:hypothetical protein